MGQKSKHGAATSELTTHRTTDASQVPNPLGGKDSEMAWMTADGAYDAGPVYERLKNITPITRRR